MLLYRTASFSKCALTAAARMPGWNVVHPFESVTSRFDGLLFGSRKTGSPRPKLNDVTFFTPALSAGAMPDVGTQSEFLLLISNHAHILEKAELRKAALHGLYGNSLFTARVFTLFFFGRKFGSSRGSCPLWYLSGGFSMFRYQRIYPDQRSVLPAFSVLRSLPEAFAIGRQVSRHSTCLRWDLILISH